MRKPLLAGLTFSLLLFGILLTLLLPPRASRVTRANYGRIEEGMSRAQVEEVLGGPGDYTTEPTALSLVPLPTSYEEFTVWLTRGGSGPPGTCW
jgi:hypothetical protein